MQEDPWNSISAGFLTGGFLQLRTGPRSAAKSAVFGGVLLVSPSNAGPFPCPPQPSSGEAILFTHAARGSCKLSCRYGEASTAQPSGFVGMRATGQAADKPEP